MQRWLETVGARPGVIVGRALAADLRREPKTDPSAQNTLFGKRD